MASGQAELPLPAAEELFPSLQRSFAEYCAAKIRAMLAGSQARDKSPAARVWDLDFWRRDREHLARRAGFDETLILAIGLAEWGDLTEAQRARLLAAFEERAYWYRKHADFSIGADPEEFAAELNRSRAP